MEQIDTTAALSAMPTSRPLGLAMVIFECIEVFGRHKADPVAPRIAAPPATRYVPDAVAGVVAGLLNNPKRAALLVEKKSANQL